MLRDYQLFVFQHLICAKQKIKDKMWEIKIVNTGNIGVILLTINSLTKLYIVIIV